MLTTKRKPATVGEILLEEFMQPIGLTQTALAQAMGVQRKHVNELCNDRRTVTAATALILARVFGNSPDFWLNVQRRSDLWEAMQRPQPAQTDRTRRAAGPRSVIWLAMRGCRSGIFWLTKRSFEFVRADNSDQLSFLHNTLSEVNFPAPGGCT